jgi:GPI-anchor transamidase subunit T
MARRIRERFSKQSFASYLYTIVSIAQRWKGIRDALAGLFCASLGSTDGKGTTSAMVSFAEGFSPNRTHRQHLRHIALPSETVCTENLTPFLKLLPCKSLSGLARLLNPHRVFDADWYGMGIHVLPHLDAGVEVRLTFQAVSDPVRLSPARRRGEIL